MTLIELSIGLVICALVIGALSALWFAVAETWRTSSSSQGMTLRASQVVTRLESTVRQAKYICQLTSGSVTDCNAAAASVFLWRCDSWNAAGDVNNAANFKIEAPDNLPQVAELALIEYDATAQRIYLYQAKDPATMNASQRTAAGTVWTWSDLSKPSNLGTFKSLSYVEKRVLSEGVSACAVNMPALSSTARPMLEFTLTLTRSGVNTVVYSVASLRAASARPS
jgi:hypothetical protein